jgi:hypothetical protein
MPSMEQIRRASGGEDDLNLEDKILGDLSGENAARDRRAHLTVVETPSAEEQAKTLLAEVLEYEVTRSIPATGFVGKPD